MSLLRPWRAPITTLSQIVLVGMFAVTFGMTDATQRPLWELRRQWGGIEELQWVANDGPHSKVIDANLKGPFDLWDGEWWRIPISNFHHADILHLLLNIGFVSYFGTILEARWGSFKYLALIAGAMFVVLLPEYLAGRIAIGYSGVACAIFGALWAMRRRDPVVSELLTNEVVISTLAILAGLVLLTLAEAMPVANGAHAAGLIYGYLAATAGAVGTSWRGSQRLAFWAAHLGLIYPYWMVTHPTWNGRYEWYQADLPGKHGRRGEPNWNGLEQAVAKDPTLTEVWRKLSERAIEEHDLYAAWKLLIRGLASAPSDAEQWNRCRALWRRLCITPDAEAAMHYVEEQFGTEAASVKRELRRIISPPVLIAPGQPVQPTPQFVIVQPAAEPPPPWEPPYERVWPPRRELQQPLSAPLLNAVEGETL